jgi:hypothetical protein
MEHALKPTCLLAEAIVARQLWWGNPHHGTLKKTFNFFEKIVDSLLEPCHSWHTHGKHKLQNNENKSTT